MKSILLSLFALYTLSATAQNALLFDGTNDYVQCPLPGPLGNASRTVEAWVKIPLLISTQRVILDYGDMLTGGRFTLNIINGLPRIEVGGNGFSATTAISTNTWHHIAATFDNTATSKLKLFVDGTLAASGNPSVTTFTNATNGIAIGRRNDLTGYFSGYIDEVKVWNIARSQAEITADMSTNFCLPFNGIVAYFNFNQGTANGTNAGLNVLNNQANAANNGTITNFALSGNASNWSNGQIMNNLSISLSSLGNTFTVLPAGASYQWLNCASGNSPILGATNSTYTATTTGTYAVIVSKNGCSDTSACVNLIVSLLEVGKEEYLHFFPNPFSNKLSIEFSSLNAEKNSIVNLFNNQGKLVFANEKIFEKITSFDFSEFPSGIYFMEVMSAAGSFRKKLIKE